MMIKLPEDRWRAHSWNIMYIKHISDNGWCPT